MFKKLLLQWLLRDEDLLQSISQSYKVAVTRKESVKEETIKSLPMHRKTKTCKKCGNIKKGNCFGQNSTQPDGLTKWCLSCMYPSRD